MNVMTHSHTHTHARRDKKVAQNFNLVKRTNNVYLSFLKDPKKKKGKKHTCRCRMTGSQKMSSHIEMLAPF